MAEQFYSEFCPCTPIAGDDGREAWRICFWPVFDHAAELYAEAIGPAFGRKQDSDRAIAVLESLGFTPQSAVNMPDEEWKVVRRKIVEAMQW